MGKTNIFTVFTAVIVQFVVGYLWYGPHLFGDVIAANGGHAIDFLKLDGISLLLILLSGYGLTHVLGVINKAVGVKDVNAGVRVALNIGIFAIGFPVALLLSLMGIGKVALLVIFMYLVLITVVTNLVVIKLKHG